MHQDELVFYIFFSKIQLLCLLQVLDIRVMETDQLMREGNLVIRAPLLYIFDLMQVDPGNHPGCNDPKAIFFLAIFQF